MAKMSLQDQLLKAGLVTTAQARSAKTEKRKQEQQQRKNKTDIQDELKESVRLMQVEKIERDKEFNRLRKEQEEQKHIAAQIKQIIENNCLPLDSEGGPYNFTDQKKVKTIYISDFMRKGIAEGKFAIVKHEQHYVVVMAEIAEKIRLREAARVIVFNESEKGRQITDEYAAFQVPDDLIW